MEEWWFEWSESDSEQCWTELWSMWRSEGLRGQLASKWVKEGSKYKVEPEPDSWDGWKEVLSGDTFSRRIDRRDG